MGVHGRTFVGKASTRSSLDSVRNKKSIVTEINSQLKCVSPKSSASSTAAGTRSNASASVDANMAPTLTEPLSPTEKLSNSSTNVTPTSISLKKESEELQVESSALSLAGNSNNTSQREKRNSSRNIPISTRITRSKDSPIAPERASTPSAVRSSPIASGTKKLKLDTANDTVRDPPMGLSAATPSTTSTLSEKQSTSTADSETNSITANNNNNNNNKIACKDSTTEQLLADLTTDFEETITAEICLRKQLPEVKVSTPDAGQLISSEGEADISAIKGICQDRGESELSVHMESASKNSSDDDNKTEATQPSAENVKKNQKENSEKDPGVNGDNAASMATASQTIVTPSSGERILATEDLPLINSDSTMTASEEETEELDALEARLSQLDGTAVTPITNDDGNVTLTPTTFATAASSNAMITSATPPRTPSQLQLTPTPVTTSGTTVQQLLLTPTSSSSQTLALTPQSTSSLMREVGATVTTGEIEEEFEEVLKALKGFDANSANADTVLDLNVLFNEVYTSLNCEDMGNNQQQNILPAIGNSDVVKVPVSPLKELHGEIEKKQQSMQRKIDFIMRRLRKLQVRYMSKHTTEEIAGLFELAARLTNKGSSQTHSSGDMVTKSVISARPPAQSWEEDIKHPIPASQVTNLLHRLEISANAQQLCTTTSNNGNMPSYSAPTLSSTQQLKKSKKFGDTASSPVAIAEVDQPKGDEVVPTFTPQIVDELTHVAGMLRAEMRDIQTAYDSDATESSSGGESADEMVTYNNQVQQSLSIVKRAAWRYSRERAAIASRWSWLLSQIADLEIKIRQHSELYQEVVRTKGAVVCEEELAKTVTSAAHETVNAYGKTEENTLPGAARTRGFVPSQFRKRKLLQTTNLHTISKKAARPSTIKCGCQWPLNPCALCTGRTDPTALRDLPDTMMFSERVALLDPGYHPVLSFPEDVNNSIHIEAIARTPNWQQRIIRIQPKSVARSIWKAEREAANSSSHSTSRKFGDVLLPTQKRRYIRRKDRNATTSSSLSVSGSSTAASLGTTPISGVHHSSINASVSSTGDYSKSGMPQTTPTTPILNSNLESTATVGNGTANLFTSTTTSTTPLVANKVTAPKQLAQSSKKMHCHLVGDGILLEPLSPSSNNQMNDCQTLQNFEQYNPSQAHSSLISNHHQQHNNNSNKKGKIRKSINSVGLQQQINSNHNSNTNYNYQHNHNNITQYQQNYSNGDNTSDYWDSIGGRSRTASPTHGIGGNSNYHKYERSLERRNRISYDIDNIVIPYSVAATTRVEILPYKEIPTPKWRVFDEEAEAKTELTNEAKLDTKSVVDNEEAQQDVLMKEVIPLKPNTKVESDSNTTKSFPKKDIETENEKHTVVTTTLEDKCTNEDKSNQQEKNKVEATKSTLLNDVESSRPGPKAVMCDTTADSSTQGIEEPPAKKAKVSRDSGESTEIADSISVASLSATSKEGQKKTVVGEAVAISDESDSPEKEQILFADLEEDITEEAFILRHERALNEERRKFQTYLKFPWSTRSRANRRIDSRAESSGANTPDPASPAPNTPSLGGGDQESIPSPLAPSTPLTPLETINETPESGSTNNVSSAHSSNTIAPPAFPTTVASISTKRNERRRTTSAKNQHLERNERRSLTPDSREVPFIVPPYEPLKFPLSDETFEMLSSVTLMPPSVNSLYADDYTSKEDHHSGIGAGTSGSNYFKSVVSARTSRRSSVRSEFILQRSMSKTAAAINTNCDVNGKRRRINKRHSLIDMAHQVAESSDATKFLPYVNGKSKNLVGITATTATTNSTDVDDEAEDDDVDFYNDILDDEDEDDGYPKHPLAPGNDIVDSFVDDGYNAYMGDGNSNSLLGVSDSESEVDPFEDDDPNDPEWKGESRLERPERFRKRS